MKYLQNLHTHSTYCDGKDTPEEIILAAIAKGHFSVGFSGHSYMHFSKGISMSPERTEQYKKEIRALAEKYKDRIDVFCGIECEMYSEIDLSGYDYLIGSVHYFKLGETYVGFDRSQEAVREIIDTHFGGDGMKYAKEYYSTISRLPEYGNFDIIGHYDLVTKHSDNVKFFDEDSKEYKDAALSAIHALKGKIPFFEVNTGAIARGYRKTPYPAPFLVKEFKRLGFGAVISSDCHNSEFLDHRFDDAAELLKECGFTERYVLTKNGFEAVSL